MGRLILSSAEPRSVCGIIRILADELAQLNREISHENVVALREVILEDKSIYMVFEYAEHDFLVRSVFPLRSSRIHL